MDVLPPSPLSTEQESEDEFSTACGAWGDASEAVLRYSCNGDGWCFLHMLQVALFLKSFELCPFLRQPKHRFFSSMNLFFSSGDLLANVWHLWIEWVSQQYMHLTELEELNGTFTLFDSFASLPLCCSPQHLVFSSLCWIFLILLCL